ATLKEAEAKTDEVEAEAKRRDQKNEPVYALLRKNGQVVGAIYRDGLGEYVGNEIGQFWGRSETAEQIANRAKQANIDGLTIEVFGNSDMGPTRSQTSAMMSNTLGKNKQPKVRSEINNEKNDIFEMTKIFKQKIEEERKSFQSETPSEHETTAERWQRNIDWFKTDHSA
ncbi:hypothetical protein VZ95_19325, partial [Elstera litoralis]